MILMIQIVILILIFLAIALIRLWKYMRASREKQHADLIKRLISASIQKKQILEVSSIPKGLRHLSDLLPILEIYDHDFSDFIWQQTKNQLIDQVLLKEAKVFMLSRDWVKRQMGLRCIALDPERLIDETQVMPLLNDPKFLVRIVAASCLIRSKRPHLLLPTIQRMAKESTMARYPYRDCLINSGAETFVCLAQLAAQETDPELIAICLDVLSTKISHNLSQLAIKHVTSQNIPCRLASIKILSKIASPDSQKWLISSLEDPEWEIRAEGAKALGKILAFKSIPQLNLLLNDKEWFVRLQAALALKAMGIQGRQVLNVQEQQKNPEAYEIANYVLALP